MPKPKFQIGDWVLVSRQAVFTVLRDSTRAIVYEYCGRIGQICGMCRRFSGKVETEIVDRTEYGIVREGHLKVKESHLLYQVRFGMLNAPIEGAECDLFECDPLPHGLPMLYQPNAQRTWTARTRADASELSQSWPRDGKGRWMKA
jgi:hypothetical protein